MTWRNIVFKGKKRDEGPRITHAQEKSVAHKSSAMQLFPGPHQAGWVSRLKQTSLIFI